MAQVGDEALKAMQHALATASLAAAARLAADEAAADPLEAASLRSAGGPGASALLQVPTLPCHRLTNAQLGIALRCRLNLDLPGCAGPGRLCQHRPPDGRTAASR